MLYYGGDGDDCDDDDVNEVEVHAYEEPLFHEALQMRTLPSYRLLK